MRSEERAGIISVVMLFVWGTLITEPFHIFARYIAKAVGYAVRGLGDESIIGSLILYVVVIASVILLQFMSQTKLRNFMPCILSSVCIATLVIRSIVKSHVDFGDAISLAVPAIAAIIFYLTKFENGLKWYTDVYTYSLAIALINSLLFVPLAKQNGVVDKILYITNYNDLKITAPFAGLAGIPELVWGLFLTAFAVIPIIYLATSNKRK